MGGWRALDCETAGIKMVGSRTIKRIECLSVQHRHTLQCAEEFWHSLEEEDQRSGVQRGGNVDGRN